LIFLIKQFHFRTSFTFYTDGSVQNLGTHNINVDIAWTEISTILPTQFQAAMDIHWISSTKTELLAIISAIITALVASHVNIYTDSKSVIDKFCHLNSYQSSYFCYPRLTFKNTYNDL